VFSQPNAVPSCQATIGQQKAPWCARRTPRLGYFLKDRMTGKMGVDKKHGSYERYLAQKVGNSKPCQSWYTSI